MTFRLSLLAAFCLILPRVAAQPPDFDRDVAPLLSRHCLDCHGDGAAKGKLNLASRKGPLAGGRSGAALQPGKPGDSLLWQRVEADEMPPKKPLAETEKAVLKRWIEGGARWGTDPIDPFQASTDHRAGYDWWSLRPLTSPEPPKANRRDWPTNPIDNFILARLQANKLTPSEPAGRRALLRRLSFDLLGLPPSAEDVERFVSDRDERAYEKLVDRYLASPHYGERWGRHWLDVVRFGESDGFERDLPRPNAWPYRDWVIDALNDDMPYDEFVRLQVAGDILKPGDPAALAATGFLVAGPHDIVMPVSQSMRETMRQDEMEDLLGVVGQTFLGLTVNCARCHDHKFDPISQADYYRLAAALAGVRHGERTIDSPRTARELVQEQKRLDEQRRRLADIEGPARRAALAERGRKDEGPRPLAEWDFREGLKDRVGGLHGTLKGAAKQTAAGLKLDGKTGHLVTAPLGKDLGARTLEAWVQLDSLDQRGGGVLTVQTSDGSVFDSIVIGEQEKGHWLAGSDFFRRTQPAGGPAEREANRRPVHLAVTYADDGTISLYREGLPYGKGYRKADLVTFKAGAAHVVFGLRHGPPGGNKMLAGTVVRARLYDRALTADEVAASSGSQVSEAEIVKQLKEEERKRRRELQAEIAAGEARVQKLQARALGKVFAVVPAAPGRTRLLRRGSVDTPGEEVTAGGIRGLTALAFDFKLGPDASDGDRRVALARWLTDPANPLTSRVIVNRLWHHHFGVGLVDTPNDLGFSGGRPSHPELLDWLAGELRRNRGSLKAVHRLIVTSATYRQASAPREDCRKVDADNRLLWRFPPQRLDAESLRDAMLDTAGVLDRTIGGKGYEDFRSYFFKGTQFYDPVEQVGPGFRRRTVYRMNARGGRNPFLDTFDCPDPSTPTPRRASTTTPLQALAQLNNALVFDLADQLARRVRREAGDDAGRQVRRLYLLVYGRPPDQDEVKLIEPFLARHGLPALCRVVFNSNEFLTLD